MIMESSIKNGVTGGVPIYQKSNLYLLLCKVTTFISLCNTFKVGSIN